MADYYNSCIFSVNSIMRAETIRTVALSDTQAPGTAIGTDFASFAYHVAVNNNGHTAIHSRLKGTGVDGSNDWGTWSEGETGELKLIAREGDPAPGTPSGVTFQTLGIPALDESGHSTFLGVLTGTGINNSNDWGIWSESGGNGLVLIARMGNSAPTNTSGTVFTDFNFFLPNQNSVGQISFSGTIAGPGVNGTNEHGIWSQGSGALALLAREGSPTPGITGAVFGGFRHPILNDNGQAAFSARTGGNVWGIWTGTSRGDLSLSVREGDDALGTETGVKFGYPGDPEINNNGHIATMALLTGGSSWSANDSGIWSEGGNGGLTLVAREGEEAPGTESGTVFSDAYETPKLFGSGFGTPVLNANGHLAFQAFVAGPSVSTDSNNGIWKSSSEGDLEMVARANDPAPGTNNGVLFNSFHEHNFFINGLGQIAFAAELTGVGVNSSNDLGMWAEDTSGALQLIVREGDLLDVDDGPGVDTRIVASLEFYGKSNTQPGSTSGNEDGHPSSFNDSGELLFGAQFTDGIDGVFVSSLVRPPIEYPADFNSDGKVDFADLVQWEGDFGLNGDSDSDDDLDSDGADFLTWQQQFGSGIAVSESESGSTLLVPEPSTAAILIVCCSLTAMSRIQRSRLSNACKIRFGRIRRNKDT